MRGPVRQQAARHAPTLARCARRCRAYPTTRSLSKPLSAPIPLFGQALSAGHIADAIIAAPFVDEKKGEHHLDDSYRAVPG
jgi:hypothetical protein